MNKDIWVRQQVRNYGSFKGALIFYGIIVLTFVGTALMMV